MATKHLVSNDWDVEQYRNEWENDAQWNLRKQFMLAYKDAIPEDKLVCWAQVYGNIQAYQCRYPVEVMDQIEKLSANLPVDAGRLPHVKGPKSRIVFQKEGSNATVASRNNTELTEDDIKPLKTGQDVCNTKYLNSGMNLSNQFDHKLHRNYQQDVTPSGSYDKDSKQDMTQFNNFVIMIDENNLNNGIESILQQCAAFNKLYCCFTNKNVNNCSTDKRFRYAIEFDGVVFGEGTSFKMQEAKRLAAKSAFMKLSQVAYTLIVKVADPNKRLTKLSLGVVPEEEEGNCIADDSISESNVGHKLLRLMGWSGGGLGRIGNEGITEPIKAATQKWSRKGLGLPESGSGNQFALKQFRQRITTVLREFSSTGIDNALVFSAEFSKEERAIIHSICKRFRLHGSSRGNDKKGSRYLTIRHVSPDKLKRHALLHGGLSDKYEVLPPGSSWPRIKEILKFD